MMSIRIVLLILALLCFLIAAIGRPPTGTVNPTALGLAFWVASLLIA